MPYTPYYAAWEDDPSTDTPITAAALQNMETGIAGAAATAEAAIPKAISGVATDKVPVYNGSAWVAQKVVDAQIDAAAAIAVSKLAPGSNGQVLSVSAGTATWMAASVTSAAFTPTWAADSGVAPSLGDGVLEGYYTKVGRLVNVVMGLTFGTTTSGGSGGNFWTFTVPVTGSWTSNPVGGGGGYLEDFATQGYPPVTVRILGTTSVVVYSGTALIYASSPFVWGAGDYLGISYSYLTS
jgi:hypothetical protein